MSDNRPASQFSVRLIFALLRCIPPRFAWWFGASAGHAYAYLSVRDVRRCRAMLSKGFPEKNSAAINALVHKTFAHAGRMALWSAATLHWDMHKLRRHIAVEGRSSIRAHIRGTKKGESTVGFTGHFGNWELLSRVGGTLTPLTVVGKRLRSPLADALVQQARMASGARVLYQDAPFQDFARELRAGRMLAVLVDQDIERLAGCFVPWFGDLAYTPSGPAAIAQLTRSFVMPVFLYEKAGRWVLHCGPRIKFPRSKDSAADAEKITAWVTAYEEQLVRRAPHQWVWWHLRWRTRPR
jgi:Kdo2-lipid IVA lauroyltransferase/acyltransferase